MLKAHTFCMKKDSTYHSISTLGFCTVFNPPWFPSTTLFSSVGGMRDLLVPTPRWDNILPMPTIVIPLLHLSNNICQQQLKPIRN